MGEAFDGWGYGMSGFFVWIFHGLPLSALLFLGWGIHLFFQSRSQYAHIRHHRLRIWWFLLRSLGGIVAGSFAGYLLTLLLISPHVLKSEHPSIPFPIVHLIAIISPSVGIICAMKLYRK